MVGIAETGLEAVERVAELRPDLVMMDIRMPDILDAAHAVSLQCRRNLAVRKPTPREERAQLLEKAQPPVDAFARIHRREMPAEPDLRRIPLSPDEDLLVFIRDHNPYLSEWEKDLLSIVHEEACYFIPQIETKIMNEGWATYWHKRILDSLRLPQDLQIEFIVRHNQVVRPFPSGINPYHIGLRVWEDIRRRFDKPTPEESRDLAPAHPSGDDRLFEVREADRDASFLRRHLSAALMRELNLFAYETRGDTLVVGDISDEDGWRKVKETLIRNAGMGPIPVIKVEDADFGHNRILHLKHYHEGRDLQIEYAEKTLAYVRRLWQHDVVLETVLEGTPALLAFEDGELTRRQP